MRAFFQITAITIFLVSNLGWNILENENDFDHSKSVDVQNFYTAPCMFDIPPGTIEGKDIQCGFLIVPEDYENLSGPSIRLAVAIIKSKEKTNHSDPLFMAQGGPGGSTIDTYVDLIFSQDRRFVPNRDIVLLEQRGTFFSEPNLTCPEVLEETIHALGMDSNPEEDIRLYEKAITECHDRLTSEGINFSAFNSLNNAHDFESLRLALGLDKYNLYGVSYGTLLALHIMRNYSIGLRSVVLDAVVPPQTNFLVEAPQSEMRAFGHLFSACSLDEKCQSDFPMLENKFFDTLSLLNDKPANIKISDFDTGITYKTKLDGEAFRNLIFQMLYFTEIIPFLPKIIYDASEGKFLFIEQIYGLITFDRTMSYGMYYSVLCAEDADFSLDDLNLAGLNEETLEIDKLNLTSFLTTCETWTSHPIGPSIDEPVVSDIPTLIITGEFDPITPPNFGEEVAKTLSNSFLVTFPTGGHGAAMTGECQDQIIFDFLENPAQRPDTHCIEYISEEFLRSSKNTMFLPAIGKLLNLQGIYPWQLIIVLGNVIFLMSSPFVWLFVWVYKYISKKHVKKNNNFSTILKWITCINGIIIFIFFTAITILSIKLVIENNLLLFFGLPIETRPLFWLPFIALLLTFIMAFGTVFCWLKGYCSFLNRLYFSFLTISVVVVLLILQSWDMIFSSFP